ncbi:hypothetical protein GS399_20225 [Pedobacter sp. HMF7647]|uniref:SnoaL-like domain-containing protein n=1 Tax=Hufsiella arboris TaxID=2695275 RepID=A0A7K1YGF8_9SPHI|nr:nuclear transport factor 2 family protein [Hufsiella arboris]MXV53298.1 hypothetical protein [Hufsiella arboris]
MIDNIDHFFRELYGNFNKRNIEPVISNMTDDVKWANGMDGGYVYGHAGVESYWIRQFSMVNSNVTPLEISKENNTVKIKVQQVVHDLAGNQLADEIVYHFFRLRDDKITEFSTGEKGEV